MKKFMIATAVAVSTLSVAIGGTLVSAPDRNGSASTSESVVMPVTQELPFGHFVGTVL